MDKKVYNILKYVLSALLALVLLWLCFRKIAWSDIAEGLRACRWGWVVVSMVLGAAAFVIRALRWHLLLRPLDPSTRVSAALNGINIGYLVNIALSRVGELVRCGVVSRRSARDESGKPLASYEKVLGTIVLDRVWDFLVSALLVAVVAVLMWGRYSGILREMFSSGEGLPLAVWILVGAIALGVVYTAIVWALRRKAFFAPQWRIVSGLFQGAGTCLRMERSWRFFLYTGAIWALYVVMVSCIATAFPGLGLDGWDCLMLMAVGSIAQVLPVPGGFGAYHYVVATAVAAICGVPFATGLVFATVSHESQVLTQVIAGTASYVSESFHKI